MRSPNESRSFKFVETTASEFSHEPLAVNLLPPQNAVQNSILRYHRMSAIADVVQAAQADGRMTFMPFVTAGDPDIATTREVLLGLRDANVDLIELGFPYSDPIADGPVIQASYTRALDNGLTVQQILDLMEGLREAGLPPVLAMVSFAIIFRFGVREFAQTARDVGFRGLIVPDLPADEAEEMSAIAQQHDLDLVQLIAPTTTAERTQQILDASSGFVYCVSVAGTTGVRNDLPEELTTQLQQLRTATALPLAVGFGISGPEHVARLEGVADGVIVGSAIVRRVAEADDSEAAATAVRDFSAEMRKAVETVKPYR